MYTIAVNNLVVSFIFIYLKNWLSALHVLILGQSIDAKLWLDPPQMATEAFSSDLLPERSPE